MEKLDKIKILKLLLMIIVRKLVREYSPNQNFTLREDKFCSMSIYVRIIQKKHVVSEISTVFRHI